MVLPSDLSPTYAHRDGISAGPHLLQPHHSRSPHHAFCDCRLGYTNPARVYDLFGEILAALSLFSLVLCAFLYFKVSQIFFLALNKTFTVGLCYIVLTSFLMGLTTSSKTFATGFPVSHVLCHRVAPAAHRNTFACKLQATTALMLLHVSETFPK